MAEPRKVPWLAAPMVLATIAYARVLHGELQLDDFAGIAQNPAIKHVGAFARELPARWLAGGRPLTDLTFAVNYAAGRLEPAGYHAVNLELHIVASVLLWALARVVAHLAGSARPGVAAFWTAGLFA